MEKMTFCCLDMSFYRAGLISLDGIGVFVVAGLLRKNEWALDGTFIIICCNFAFAWVNGFMASGAKANGRYSDHRG